MVLLFKLAEVTRVRMNVEDTLVMCGAAVVGEDYVDTCFLGWEQESIPAMFIELHFPQISYLKSSINWTSVILVLTK